MAIINFPYCIVLDKATEKTFDIKLFRAYVLFQY